MTLPNLCPFAKWRPLSSNQTEPAIKPRVLIFHTMVGFLSSTERYFKTNNGKGFDGTESTYGVGGPWDGDALDGVLYQWQGNLFQADAQAGANDYATSIETSDGGIWKPKTPAWSAKQITTLIKLGAWWCKANDADPVLVKSPQGKGIGYHSQFDDWNSLSKTCPGALRIEQLREVVIPGIQRKFDEVVPPKPEPAFPAFPLGKDKFFGPRSQGGVPSGNGLRKWQQQMRNRGWSLVADDIYGVQTESVAREFQEQKKLTVDGLIGRQTWDAAWRAPITKD